MTKYLSQPSELTAFDNSDKLVANVVNSYNHSRISNRAYNKGDAVRAVANEFGYSQKGIKGMLDYAKQAGFYVRSNKLDDWERLSTVSLYDGGKSIREIANELGRSESAVRGMIGSNDARIAALKQYAGAKIVPYEEKVAARAEVSEEKPYRRSFLDRLTNAAAAAGVLITTLLSNTVFGVPQDDEKVNSVNKTPVITGDLRAGERFEYEPPFGERAIVKGNKVIGYAPEYKPQPFVAGPLPPKDSEGVNIPGGFRGRVDAFGGDSTGFSARAAAKFGSNDGKYSAGVDVVGGFKTGENKNGETITNSEFGVKASGRAGGTQITFNHGQSQRTQDGESKDVIIGTEVPLTSTETNNKYNENAKRIIDAVTLKSDGDLLGFGARYAFDKTNTTGKNGLRSIVTFPNDPMLPPIVLDNEVASELEQKAHILYGEGHVKFQPYSGFDLNLGAAGRGKLIGVKQNASVDGNEVISEDTDMTLWSYGPTLRFATDWLRGGIVAFRNEADKDTKLESDQRYEGAAHLIVPSCSDLLNLSVGAGYGRVNGRNKGRIALSFGARNSTDAADDLERILSATEEHDLFPDGRLPTQAFWEGYDALTGASDGAWTFFFEGSKGSRGAKSAYRAGVAMPFGIPGTELVVPWLRLEGWGEQTEDGSRIIRVSPQILVPSKGFKIGPTIFNMKDETGTSTGGGLEGSFSF